MRVFKFGGASVKDADGVKNLAQIIKSYPTTNLLIVVSAMGKTTDALEKLCKYYVEGNEDVQDILKAIKQFHEKDFTCNCFHFVFGCLVYC